MNVLKCALLISGVAALLAVAVGCKKQSASGVAFPQTNEVSGWTKSGETRTFAASELSNYIDGDAEKYLKAGVRETSTADYKFSDQTQAVADVYACPPQTAQKAFLTRSLRSALPTHRLAMPLVSIRKAWCFGKDRTWSALSLTRFRLNCNRHCLISDMESKRS